MDAPTGREQWSRNALGREKPLCEQSHPCPALEQALDIVKDRKIERWHRQPKAPMSLDDDCDTLTISDQWGDRMRRRDLLSADCSPRAWRRRVPAQPKGRTRQILLIGHAWSEPWVTGSGSPGGPS